MKTSAIGDGAVIQADPGTGFALDDGLDIFQRADHRRAASVAGELAGGLHLRPHGAGGKAEFVQLVGVSFGDGFLRRLAPVDIGGVDVGGDYQQVGVELFGEQ